MNQISTSLGKFPAPMYILGEVCLDSPAIRQTRIARRTCIIKKLISPVASHRDTIDSETLETWKGIHYT